MLTHSRSAVVASLCLLGACATFSLRRIPSNIDRLSVVQVVNRTTTDFRMFIVAGKTRRQLGSVPSQEMREFQLARFADVTDNEVYLIAMPRDGRGDTRVSLEFRAEEGRTATWTLDGTLLRTVIVR